jgi:hypothetical protein
MMKSFLINDLNVDEVNRVLKDLQREIGRAPKQSQSDTSTGVSSLSLALATAGNSPFTPITIGLTMPNIFTVTGSPIYNNGTFVVTLTDEAMNKSFMSPDGHDGTPTFRDILTPDLQQATGDLVDLTSLFNISSGSHAVVGSGTSLSLMPQPPNKAFMSPDAVTGLPSFRDINAIDVRDSTTVGRSLLTLANPDAITFPRFNANNSVSALNASDFRTAIGAGTVTSVGLGMPRQFIVTNSPVTGSGILTAAWDPVPYGYALMGPDRGTPQVPSFRPFIISDISDSTAIGKALLSITTPAEVVFPRFNTDATVSSLNAADFRTAIGAGTVTAVTATLPITSSGGTAPNIAMPRASTTVDGYLDHTDFITFNSSAFGLNCGGAEAIGSAAINCGGAA